MTAYIFEKLDTEGNVLVIKATEANHLPMPVKIALFSKGSKDFPLDSDKLAANLLDLLNGGAPKYAVDSAGNRIFYRRYNNGVGLQWQDKGGGVSHDGGPALILDSQEGQERAASLGKALMAKLTNEFMKRFCDAVEYDAAAPGKDQGTRKSDPGQGFRAS